MTALLICSSLKGIDVSGCTQFSSRDIINIACHLPHFFVSVPGRIHVFCEFQ